MSENSTRVSCAGHPWVMSLKHSPMCKMDGHSIGNVLAAVQFKIGMIGTHTWECGTRGSYSYIPIAIPFRVRAVPWQRSGKARAAASEGAGGSGEAEAPPALHTAAAGVRMRGTKSNFRVQSGARANGNSSHPNPLRSVSSYFIRICCASTTLDD